MKTVLNIFRQLLFSLQNLVLGILNKKKEKKKVFRRISGTNISCLEISRGISLLTNDNRNCTLTDFQLDQQQEKPLVVLFGWLSAKRQHTDKYADIWIEKGFDVLIVIINAADLILPVRGTHVIAANAIRFLDQNKCYTQILLHGFSAGGYEWAEMMLQMLKNIRRYQHILDRIVGQVWDSLTDMEEVYMGISNAVFPKNKFMASALQNYILFHLRIFEKVATRYYRAASQSFHTNVAKAPTLLIFSKSDPIGTESTSKLVRKNWESQGVKVDWKVFEKSPHVGHFRKYPKEYVAALHRFLDSHNLTKSNHIHNVTEINPI